MKYQEALEGVLLSLEGERMPEVIKRIRTKAKTRKKDKTIIKDIENFLLDDTNSMIPNAIYDWDESDWLYRSDVFAEMAFLIRMNDYEWENKNLVLGHRMIPFMNVSKINSGDIKLFSKEGEEFLLASRELTLEDGLPFISFIPPYVRESYVVFGDNGMTFDSYDLSSFMKDNDFKKDDLLEFFPKDYNKNEFFVTKKTAVEFKRETLAMNNRTNILAAALEEELDAMETDGGVLDHALFGAFALAQDKLGGHAGYPIAQLVHQWVDEETFYINNMAGATLIFNEDPMVLAMSMMDDSLLDMEDMEDMEMSEWEDNLDSLLEDIGNSYKEDFVKIDFILQLHKEDKIDVEKTMEVLFAGKPYAYEDDEKEELKGKLLELKPEIIEAWQGIRLSPEKQQFVKTAYHAKQRIIGILKELDALYLRPHELNMNKMQPLIEIEMTVDALFEMLIESKDLPKIFINQLKEPFSQLLTVLEEIKKDIWADFI